MSYRPDWFPDWQGATAVVVASGPSASGVPLHLAKGRARFVVVNNSWQLAPWADVLFAADEAWWTAHGGVPDFKGLKVSSDPRSYRYHADVLQVLVRQNRDDMLFDTLGVIGNGGGSGFQALNLTAQMNPARILMVGFDMHAEGGLHWHGPHGGDLQNPSTDHMVRWRMAMDRNAKVLAERGIEVLNCSEWSALTGYEKQEFSKALG